MSVSWKKISSVLIFLNIVLEQFFWNSLPMIFKASRFTVTVTHRHIHGNTLPILTGKPDGSCCWRNSRSLLNCLNGATTSSTFSSLQCQHPSLLSPAAFHRCTSTSSVLGRLRGCKNRPAPFPGWMSYNMTKPGSVCPVS